MGWKIFDYSCVCGNSFESMEQDCNDPVNCPKCGALATLRPSAVNLGWTNDKAKKDAMLKKRSLDHTKREQQSGNMLSPRDFDD